MINEQELQEIYRRKKQVILKYGTYVIEDHNKQSDATGMEAASEEYNSMKMNDSEGGLTMDDETRAKYEAIMPTRMEDSIQNSINALVNEQSAPEEAVLGEEQDAMIAEIMKKFQNNIQNNVNDLLSSM